MSVFVTVGILHSTNTFGILKLDIYLNSVATFLGLSADTYRSNPQLNVNIPKKNLNSSKNNKKPRIYTYILKHPLVNVYARKREIWYTHNA